LKKGFLDIWLCGKKGENRLKLISDKRLGKNIKNDQDTLNGNL